MVYLSKKIYKINDEKMILGVCAGVADYFNIDVTLVRIVTAALILGSFSFVFWLYLISAFVMPDKSDLYK